jgi:endoglucanase
MDKIETLLKELTEANGVSGYEAEVRTIMHRYFVTLGEISYDKLGSVICQKKGSAERPKVALVAHMDEVGFMVNYITKDGFIRFNALGGWWSQVLLAHRVAINTNKGIVVGEIGSTPPHLLTEDERKKIVDMREMYIDIGASSEKEILDAGVRIGDPIIPIGNFTILTNPKTYMSKAFDDRVGCAMAITVLENLTNLAHPNTAFAVATVQEEVGLRGAVTSVDAVNPDAAIILESDVAGDTPGLKPEESSVKLGAGPTLLVYDARMIPNVKFRNLVIDTAKKMDIPLQLSTAEGGATDGGMIDVHKKGVPTVVLSVPSRYIHSHNSIICRDDFDHTVELATRLVQELDRQSVADLTAW